MASAGRPSTLGGSGSRWEDDAPRASVFPHRPSQTTVSLTVPSPQFLKNETTDREDATGVGLFCRADLGHSSRAMKYNLRFEDAKRDPLPTKFPPISSFVTYHAEYLDALAAGEVTPEVIQRLNRKQKELIKHYPDYKNSGSQ